MCLFVFKGAVFSEKGKSPLPGLPQTWTEWRVFRKRNIPLPGMPQTVDRMGISNHDPEKQIELFFGCVKDGGIMTLFTR